MTRRLVIVEPNLKTVGGHCFDYVRVISREAMAAGFAVDGVFHTEADAEVAALGFSFSRVFRRHSVVEESRTGLGRLATSLIGEKAANWLRQSLLGAPADEDQAALARAAPFADELAEAMASVTWTPQSRAYFPTVFWPEAALVALQSHVITDAGGQVSVCVRFDPPEHASGRAKLRDAAQSNDLIDWCSDTDELAAAYANIFDRPVRTIRIPVDLETLHQRSTERAPAPPVRVAFIGESRREKGFHLLPQLVSDVANSGASDIRFTIQLLRPEANADPAITGAVKRLESLAGARVRLVEGALDHDAFHAILASSHVLLLPYDPQSYARRSSGLLVEGLAAGLAIVSPAADSWISRTIAREGAEQNAFTFDGGAPLLADAVIRAAKAITEKRVGPARAPSCATAPRAPWTDRL